LLPENGSGVGEVVLSRGPFSISALCYRQRCLLLEYAHARPDSRRGYDIGSQINTGGGETVCSFSMK
jgi:hypothetical protein